jgi:type I restriction enzyme S subunit
VSWPLVKLKDCCKVVGGATPRRNIEAYWDSKDVPWVTPKDVSKMDSPVLDDAPEYISKKGYDECATYLLPKGSVLFTSRAPIGNVAIAGRDMCTNQGFKSLVAGNDVDGTYLYYCMLASAKKINAQGNGATFKEVSKTIVEEFEIPLPPLEEQKRIAEILDKADSLRRKRQQAIQLADEFLRAVFLDMFGDPVTNPKGFDVKELKDMAVVTTGNTPSRSESAYYGDYIEWIKSDNINTPSDFLTTASERLSELGYGVGRHVGAGSTLITCIAGSFDCIGNAAYADREVAFNQQINALTPKEGVSSWFLYALVIFSKKHIQAASTNSMKGMVSKGKMEVIKFICPPESLQDEFGKIFSKCRDNRKKMDESKEFINGAFSSLSQQAFTGEL